MNKNKTYDPFWLISSDFTAAARDVHADIVQDQRREQEKADWAAAKPKLAEQCNGMGTCAKCAEAEMNDERLHREKQKIKRSYEKEKTKLSAGTNSTGPK